MRLNYLVTTILLALVSIARAESSVKVTIDAKSTGPVIPQHFTGLSFETKLMLPVNGQRYFRPDNNALIAMFKQLNIKSLRIGGNTADRATVPMPSEADIDSLFEFARAADVKVIYTLRLKDNPDPAPAAKVAKYIWSKYKDQVTCFAIGNEPNVYLKTEQEYRDQMNAYIKAINAPDVAPDVLFSGPGSTPGKVVWSRFLANEFGPTGKIRLITQHSYPGGSANKIAVPTTGRSEMLSDKWVAGYQKFYDSFVPTVQKHRLAYRLEECNSFFHGGANDVSNTFASALWVLDFMHWWAQHGCDGVNFHTGDGVASGEKIVPSRYAVFWTSAQGYHAHPIAYGIKAFNIGARGISIEAKVKADDSVNVTAYAVAGADKSLYVTVINKEQGDAARGARVKLAVGDGYSAAQTMMLAAPDPAAKSDVTLGGGAIQDNGDFDARWTDQSVADGAASVAVQACSATIVRFRPR